jgi:hypothetical protein
MALHLVGCVLAIASFAIVNKMVVIARFTVGTQGSIQDHPDGGFGIICPDVYPSHF